MTSEIRRFEEDRDEPRESVPAALLGVERLRSNGRKPAKPAIVERGAQISFFWQVFGGTIVSIVALVALTAYGQLTSMVTDLRRDLNEVQVDYSKKDDFNARLAVLWNSIKELQSQGASLLSLNEHAKVVDQQLGNQIKIGTDQSKDLQRKLEDLSQKVQALAERLAALEAAQRVSTR